MDRLGYPRPGPRAAPLSDPRGPLTRPLARKRLGCGPERERSRDLSAARRVPALGEQGRRTAPARAFGLPSHGTVIITGRRAAATPGRRQRGEERHGGRAGGRNYERRDSLGPCSRPTRPVVLKGVAASCERGDPLRLASPRLLARRGCVNSASLGGGVHDGRVGTGVPRS